MSQADGEGARLRAPGAYEILDTAPEASFDEVTRLASLLLGAPTSAISFVDEHRQWFKSRVGTSLIETPRNDALCAHVISSGRFVEVTDASRDPRFANNPLVHCPGGIRFYAGAPLIVPTGHCLGTLCVFDNKPRPPLSAEQRRTLQDLAGLAVERIETRKVRLQSQIAASVVAVTSDAIVAAGRDG